MIAGFNSIADSLRQLFGSERGSLTLTSAFIVPCLFGVVTAAGETAAWYELERRAQQAAEAAATAGALQRASGDTRHVELAAREAAMFRGFTDGVSTAVVDVVHPPAFGAYAGRSNAVEATVSIVFSPIVSGLFSGLGITIQARAVAEVSTIGSTCVVALQTAETGPRDFRAALPPGSECVVAPHGFRTAAIDMQVSAK